MAKKIKPQEILRGNLKTKKIYFYKCDDFQVKSRELLSGKNKEIHYPFNTRNGRQKYKYISSIVFEGVVPCDVHGVYKGWNRGLGFTRYLSPIIDFLTGYPGVGKIIISRNRSSQLKTVEIIFNIADIEKIYQSIKPFRDQQSKELKELTRVIFSKLFPQKIKKESTHYFPGQLARLIETRSAKPAQLSATDIQAISALLVSLPSGHSFIKGKKFIVTKEKFDIISIESTLKDYKKLLSRKNDSNRLEESWHQFFKKNSWILSQMFAVPMVIFGDKAYLGGKDIINAHGKIADFIYRNNFTKAVSIIEIKTHKTPLILRTAYRKPDVFSISRHLSGAINQVLDQKDTYQREYNSVSKGKDIESFNPTCIVLAGKISDVKSNRHRSFELFRNNCKDVLIITFDELFNRIEAVLEIFRNRPGNKKI